ncbi:NEL-type E3 ubiquitin ligase domain-containing protein [Pseudomonas sp. MYb541]|uniref:NEL-type E3 ubiquitin ligase domain-containing protein n=1 Tax=Pseudomonas sp. MYb541 TaxID=2745402 RepID=UPI0030B23FE3
MADLEQSGKNPVNDTRSVHGVVVQARLSSWYSAATVKRKQALHEWELNIPHWYKTLSPDRRKVLEAAHQRSMGALNMLDGILKDLKGAIEFAEPLLQAAIQQKTGRFIDVKRVFFARKEFMAADRSKVFGVEATGYCYYTGLSLIEAALQNFSANEAVESNDDDSSLITHYDFHRRPAPTTFNAGAVLARSDPLKPHVFAGLCRDLDLGKLYLAHVTSIVKPPDKPEGVSDNDAARVRSRITASTRQQILFAAEVALELGNIKQDAYTLLKELAFWKADVTWRGKSVHFSNLNMLHVELKQIIVIGPLTFGYVRGVKVFHREPCIVFIPGDPICELKEYAGLGGLQTDLVERLCSGEYRRFFSQYVPYEQQTKFFSSVKLHLDQLNMYAEDEDFDPEKTSTGTWSTGYGISMPRTWGDHSLQKVDLILSNARAMVVSTASADDNARNAWLMSLASVALTVVNVASFVVPQLAPLMLLIGAVQMLYEIATGAEAWEEGDMKEAWAHVSAVAFNVTTAVVGAKLLPMIKTPFVQALAHVRCPDANVRLYAPGLKPYLRQVSLPESLKANANGLFEHDDNLYLAENDGHYLVEPSGTGNTYRIVHPQNPSAYSPQVRLTEAGAWIHEHENPLTWTTPQLMQRLGPVAQRLGQQPLKLERICQMAAVDSSMLRKMHVDQGRVPGLLADILKRFDIDETIASEKKPGVRASLLAKHQADLFAQRYAATESESGAAVGLLKRLLGSLPDSVAQELLSHASKAEVQMIEQHQRVPLRLAEEARCYQQEVRLARAYEGLYRKTLGNDDTQRMVLHSVKTLPGWPSDLRIEVLEKTSEGGERVVDSIGPEGVAAKRLLIKFGPQNLYEVRDDKFGVLNQQADIYGAIQAAVSPEDLTVMKLTAGDRGASLKQALQQKPLMPRDQLRKLLKMQPVKPGYKPPMRLADGRFGYPLSPLRGAGRRPFVCEMKAAKLYPSKSIEAVEEMLGLSELDDAGMLARLEQLEQEFNQLNADLKDWEQKAGAVGSARDRRRVANTLKGVWRRTSPQAFASDQTPIGHILDLSDEVVGELPPITANMDHVGSLVLPRMALTDASLPFLSSFRRLRWLNMSDNHLTRLPEFADGAVTKLDLSNNAIRLTEQSRMRLERMQSLKILRLSGNRQLGWVANLHGLRNLIQIYLANTGTTTFPAGAEQLTNLAMIDLHSNRITTLPEYAYQHLDRINLHDNPFSAATRARLRLDPLDPAQWGDHVTHDEARELWLHDSPVTERVRRGMTWDEVKLNPQSDAFFTVLADTTRCAEYASGVTRPAMAERVWEMLEAAKESQAIRESLFKAADDRITCGDGSSVEFMNLESELLAAKALEMAGEGDAEGKLIATAEQLFRLKLVDVIAQRDVEARGRGFAEQVEVILAYRTRLADRLGLPVKSRGMLFPRQANVSQAAIDDAYAQVLVDERVISNKVDFFLERAFWEKHLRSHYSREFASLMELVIEEIDEKSAALDELSALQDAQDNAADQATKDAWQAKHDEVVDRLASLLGKTRDEILVDGSMQSVFYNDEMKLLGAERAREERLNLQTLTRSVLEKVGATHGAQV